MFKKELIIIGIGFVLIFGLIVLGYQWQTEKNARKQAEQLNGIMLNVSKDFIANDTKQKEKDKKILLSEIDSLRIANNIISQGLNNDKKQLINDLVKIKTVNTYNARVHYSDSISVFLSTKR